MLFLIGNGFDLALGLKTSYKDFLDWYLNEKTEHEDSRIRRFKDGIIKEIEKDIHSWSDLEMALGKYTQKYTKNDLQDFLHSYQNMKVSLKEYIHLEENKFAENSDAENVCNKIKFFLSNFYDRLPTGHKQSFMKNLSSQESSEIDFDFITFNYTQTLERFLYMYEDFGSTQLDLSDIQHFGVLGSVCHVHGHLNHDIIVGVDSKSQVKNKEILDNEEANLLLIKPYLSKKMGHIGIDEPQKLIYSKDSIFVFGLSLGDSDETWWKEIGVWLTLSERRKILIYEHVKKEIFCDMSEPKKIILKDKVKARFCNIAGLSGSEIELCIDRIFILINPYLLTAES